MEKISKKTMMLYNSTSLGNMSCLFEYYGWKWSDNKECFIKLIKEVVFDELKILIFNNDLSYASVSDAEIITKYIEQYKDEETTLYINQVNIIMNNFSSAVSFSEIKYLVFKLEKKIRQINKYFSMSVYESPRDAKSLLEAHGYKYVESNLNRSFMQDSM